MSPVLVSVGRPSKRTPEREQRLLSALAEGNTRRTACALASISQDTFGRWLASADFADAVEKAEADAEAAAVANVRSAALDPKNWTASAWWLERRRHQDWGKVDRVEVTIRQQAEKLAAELGLDPAELIAEAERIVAGAR